MLGVVHQLMGREIDILQTLLKQTAIDDVCLDDILYILGVHLHVGRIVGHDPDDGTFCTEAEATRSHHVNTATQTVLGNDANEIVNDFQAARLIAGRAAAAQHLNVGVSDQTISLFGMVRLHFSIRIV